MSVVTFCVFFFSIGRCGCRSLLHCDIKETDDSMVIFNCQVTKGVEGVECTAIYLRQAIGGQVAREAMDSTASQYLNKQGYDEMIIKEKQPSFIPKPNVVQMAVQEEKNSHHLHKNPLVALSMIKNKSDYGGAIEFIATDPVVVYYCLPHQIHINNRYIKNSRKEKKASTWIIDATRVARPVVKLNGELSGPIFLYNCCIHVGGKVISFFHSQSEAHDPTTIANWIRFMVSQGFAEPDEVVVD